MITITLPPELEKVVSERAERQGTTPELYLLADLRGRYLTAPAPPAGETTGETMADFFEGYAGTIHSGEIVPGGAHLSRETGRKFAELMVKKRQAGKL